MAKDVPAVSPLPWLNSRSNLVADAIRHAILKQDQLVLFTVSMLWRDESPSWEPEFAEHQEMLEAAGAADADRAEKLMAAHIERSLKNMPLS